MTKKKASKKSTKVESTSTENTGIENKDGPSVPEEPSPENEAAAKPLKKAKQLEIPGTERIRIDELEQAAQDYQDKRNARQELTKLEVEAKKLLANLMHKYSNGEDAPIKRNDKFEIIYRFDDTEIRLTPKDEVLKVKTISEEVAVVKTGAPDDDSEGD